MGKFVKAGIFTAMNNISKPMNNNVDNHQRFSATSNNSAIKSMETSNRANSYIINGLNKRK